jgi:hypothetical protein
LELLQTADRDADRILQAKRVEKEQLTRKGGWEDHKDPRFEKQQDDVHDSTDEGHFVDFLFSS